MKYILSALLILFFGYFHVFDPLRNVYQWVFSPIELGLEEGAAGIKDYLSFYSNMNDVRRENLELKQKVLDLESDLLELEKLKQENIALESQLMNKEELGLDRLLLPANVMGNSKDLSGSTVYLDKGKIHGVKEGNNVILDNFLVGVVKEVSSGRSLVELITSSNSSATVYDINSVQKTEGLAIGQLGTSIVVERILPNEEVSVGDIIVTSGKDGTFIPDLYVGKIQEVVDDPSQPLKRAYLNTFTDLSKIRKVFVILDRSTE